MMRAPPAWAASTDGRFTVIAMSAPLHERRDVAQPRRNDGRLGERAAHRLERLQAVPRDAQDQFVIRPEPVGPGEGEGRGGGYPRRRLTEHADVLRQDADAGDEGVVAHRRRPATRLPDRPRGERAVGGIADRQRATDRPRDLWLERAVAPFD